MNRSRLQRLPQVRLTCRAFFWWFFGFVMIQHRMRTSLYNRWAIDLFSCAWAPSWLAWKPTSFSGPSASAKSPVLCGSRKSTWWDLLEKLNHNESSDINTVATKNPTKMPIVRGAIDLRLAIFRTPNRKINSWKIQAVLKQNHMTAYHSFHLKFPFLKYTPIDKHKYFMYEQIFSF